MPAGDPIFCGILPDQFIEQEGTTFTENDYGLDEGVRIFLVHPKTSRGRYPKRGSADTIFPRMFVTDVVPRRTDSTLIELTVNYRGLVDAEAKPHKIITAAESQMYTLPALSSGTPSTLIAPVPIPTITRIRVETEEPDYDGVGQPAEEDFLIEPPDFSLSFIPDPDQSVTRNYYTGWVLLTREWEPFAGDHVWEVRDRYSFYYSVAV